MAETPGIELHSDAISINLPCLDPPPFTAHTEIESLGYLILRRSADFDEISRELNLPLATVTNCILENIAQDRIMANALFEDSRKGLQFLSLRLSRITMPLGLESIPEPRPEEILRVILGLLAIYQEVSYNKLKRIVSRIFDPELPDHILIRDLSLLAFSFGQKLILDDSMIVRFQGESGVFNISEEEIGNISPDINLTILLGALSESQSSSVQDIASKMGLKPNEQIRAQIICAIGLLYLRGTIQLAVDEEENLTDIHVLQERGYDDMPLTDNERIMLGMLSSQDKTSVKDLAKILGLSREKARAELYRLFSRGQLNLEMTRGEEIFIRGLPDLPPILQVDKLSDRERIIFGSITALENPRIDELATSLQIEEIEFYRQFYNLIGSGLLKAKIARSQVLSISRPEAQPPPQLEELKDSKLSRMVSLLEQAGESINIDSLAESIGSICLEIRMILFLLVGWGYYPHGRMINRIFIKGGKLRQLSGRIFCTSCGKEYDASSDSCPNCSQRREFCNICKIILSSEEGTAICPHCEAKYHLSHLTSWLKIREECPYCRKALKEVEIKTENRSRI